MVIPLGPGGLGGPAGPQLTGPPPPELTGKFRQIKYSVMAMVVFLAGKVLAAALLGFDVLHVLANSSSIIISSLMGIWLLKDDPSMSQAYHFLVVTCCQLCGEQCPGGLNCLLPFVVYNTINVVFAILIDGVLRQVVIEGEELKEERATFVTILLWIFIVCLAGSCIAQVFAAVFGWQAYKQASQLAGHGDFGGNATGTELIHIRRPNSQTEAREAPPAAGFAAFSGQGHRLGD